MSAPGRRKAAGSTKCPSCGGSRRFFYREGNFRKCPCGYNYRVSLGKEFSDAIDAYAEGSISADELVQASFDQEFTDITREDDAK